MIRTFRVDDQKKTNEEEGRGNKRPTRSWNGGVKEAIGYQGLNIQNML